VSTVEVATPSPCRPISRQGLRVTLQSGATVTGWLFDDGGWGWEFKKDGNSLPVGLSADAMSAMFGIYQDLLFGQRPHITKDDPT
jgi:hypothetical protein